MNIEAPEARIAPAVLISAANSKLAGITIGGLIIAGIRTAGMGSGRTNFRPLAKDRR
jgi:hypothetical protein